MCSIVLPLYKVRTYDSRGSWDWSGGERGHDSRYAGVPGEVGGCRGIEYLDRIRVSAEVGAESTQERYCKVSSTFIQYLYLRTCRRHDGTPLEGNYGVSSVHDATVTEQS